jgi:hypothetical protein
MTVSCLGQSPTGRPACRMFAESTYGVLRVGDWAGMDPALVSHA